MLSSLSHPVVTAESPAAPDPEADGQRDDDRSEDAVETTSGSDGRRSDDEERETCDLSLDSIFFALSNSRRRGVIYCLERSADALDVSRLTTLVAAMETGTAPEEITYNERKRVYTSLHQSHLPKMDDLGIVNFDRRAGTVKSAAGLKEIDCYLDVASGPKVAWSELYLGIGAVSLAVSLLGLASVAPFALVTGFAYVGALGVILLIAGAVHRSRTRTQAGEVALDTAVLEDLSEQ